jgi:hypothetical protein
MRSLTHDTTICIAGLTSALRRRATIITYTAALLDVLLNPEVGGDTFLRNVCSLSTDLAQHYIPEERIR